MTNLVEKIAESVSSLGVKRSFGDPVTIDGKEIVPVALTWFGFGGGNDQSEQGGGGGGGVSIPVGVYTNGPGGVRFEPNLIALVAVSIPLTVATGKALTLIIKALKK